MERIAGCALRAKALRTALIGALLPAAWRYWHECLGPVAPGVEPPPMPSDRHPEHGD